MKLIDLMVKENVQWPEGAEYAAQGNDKNVFYYLTAPYRFATRNELLAPRGMVHSADGKLLLDELASDWLEYVTRTEYEAAQDKAERDRIFGYADEAIDEGETPEQEKDKEMTIEQKIKDMVFHQESIARYQEQIKDNQAIVDKLHAEVTADLAALGWGEQPAGDDGELGITDWRDLRVGDVIWLQECCVPEGEYVVDDITPDDEYQPLRVVVSVDGWWPAIKINTWKFIRRPSAVK